MTSQNRPGSPQTARSAADTGNARPSQHAQPGTAPASVFEDAAAERARICALIAKGRNALARTLAAQPAQFGFGVRVSDVVDAICDELGVLQLPDPPEAA
jgi:hypothetical protein